MTEQHPYPSHFKPGCHWAIDEAWRILDQLPVGLLSNTRRFHLGGEMAGMLMRAKKHETVRDYEIRRMMANVPADWRERIESDFRAALHKVEAAA